MNPCTKVTVELLMLKNLKNQTDGDGDDDGKFDDIGDDNDNGDDDCDGDDNDGSRVDGVTVNGDVSNITLDRWNIMMFLKQTVLQAVEEKTFVFCTETSEQNGRTVLYKTTVLWTLDVIKFKGTSTQFRGIHVGGALSQTSWQCTGNLHVLRDRSHITSSLFWPFGHPLPL